MLASAWQPLSPHVLPIPAKEGSAITASTCSQDRNHTHLSSWHPGATAHTTHHETHGTHAAAQGEEGHCQLLHKTRSHSPARLREHTGVGGACSGRDGGSHTRHNQQFLTQIFSQGRAVPLR